MFILEPKCLKNEFKLIKSLKKIICQTNSIILLPKPDIFDYLDNAEF